MTPRNRSRRVICRVIKPPISGVAGDTLWPASRHLWQRETHPQGPNSPRTALPGAGYGGCPLAWSDEDPRPVPPGREDPGALVAAGRRDRGAGIMRHQYPRRRPLRAWEHPWDAGHDSAARARRHTRPRGPRGLRPPAGRRSWRAVACPGCAGAVRPAPGAGGGCLAPGRPGGPWCARHLRDCAHPARGQPGGRDFMDGYPPAVRPAVLGIEESRRGAVPIHGADPAGAGGLCGRGVQRRLHDERSGRWLLHPGARCRPAARGAPPRW